MTKLQSWLTKFFILTFIFIAFNNLYANISNIQRLKNYLYTKAKKIGIKEKILKEYLLSAKINKTILLIRKVEKKNERKKVIDFVEFQNKFRNNFSIKTASGYLVKYKKELENIEKKYGVQKEFIIAIWGAESSFGKNIGNSNIINSLLTLSLYDTKRSKYYNAQLLAILKILNDTENIMPEQIKSSFDGGMGELQFEPSNYFEYAVSYNNEKFANIWTNALDSFASIANYLYKNGWQTKEIDFAKVNFSQQNFKNISAYKNKEKKYQFWKKLGIISNHHFNNDLAYKLIIPENLKQYGFLISINLFHTLAKWNHSEFELLMLCETANLLSKNQE